MIVAEAGHTVKFRNELHDRSSSAARARGFFMTSEITHDGSGTFVSIFC
jgi:hypothetical protein